MDTRTLSPLRDERETAKLLGLSVKTLRRWRWIGKGPRFHKIGAAVRYADQDIAAYLEAAQRRSTSEAAPVVALVPGPRHRGELP